MTEYDNTNRGALFKNNRKTEEKHADYSGSVNVNGVDHWISAWVREGKNGQKFMSLSVKRKDGTSERPEQTVVKQVRQHFPDATLDDEIPF